MRLDDMSGRQHNADGSSIAKLIIVLAGLDASIVTAGASLLEFDKARIGGHLKMPY